MPWRAVWGGIAAWFFLTSGTTVSAASGQRQCSLRLVHRRATRGHDLSRATEASSLTEGRCPPQVRSHRRLCVNLSGNSLSKEVLGPWLWNDCSLKKLRVSGGYTLEVQALKGAAPAASTLSLTGEDIGPLEQEALTHLFKFNGTVTELNGIIFDEDMRSIDLSMAPLELYEVVFVAKRLGLNNALTSLNLSGCAIDAEGMDYLSKAIGTHKYIEVK